MCKSISFVVIPGFMNSSIFKRVSRSIFPHSRIALICFSVLTAAFSNALYDNRSEVNALDVYFAIKNSKRIYPDSRIKELDQFRTTFAQVAADDGIVFPVVTLEEIDESEI